MITNDARCTSQIEPSIAMAEVAFNQEENSFHQQTEVNLTKKVVNCYTWSTALYASEMLTHRKVYAKDLKCFQMWCWRRMEKISWTNRVRNVELLHTVKHERNALHNKKRKVNWTGHILHENCTLKHVFEGKI
jgi:hypothetical protein